MLHHLHICVMCLAAICVCWGLALAWQADKTQKQCNIYPWLVYLPGSFLVHLTNIKAYRLSVFLRSDGRPKPFSHGKVFRIALLWLCVTAIVLMIAVLVDPPLRTVRVVDPFRPSLNYYQCETKGATPALVALLVVGHVLVSLYYVISVRNGLEAFKDGMIIKEAFVLLYAFVLVAFILNQLGLTPSNQYIYRTAVLSVGVTVFCVRLLIGRCVNHWLPEVVLERLLHYHNVYVKPIVAAESAPNYVAAGSHQNGSVVGMNFDEDEESPLYAKESVTENSLDEMTNVIADNYRGKLFRMVAKKALCLENVDFVEAVVKYKQESEQALIKCSGEASNRIRDSAKQVHRMYVDSNAESEVNLSSKTRAIVQQILSDWEDNVPLLSEEKARGVIQEDVKKRSAVFDRADKEIKVMLYQNLWNKFRIEETQSLAAGESKHGGSASSRGITPV